MSTIGELRERSTRFISLNGLWNFAYYPNLYALDEEVQKDHAAHKPAFYEKDYQGNLEHTLNGKQQVQVPATWQDYGVDIAHYTNIQYPFPLDPPHVPNENPCAVYTKKFTYEQDENAPECFLNFEGVDSCFYVWLNGNYVGYSQVSHATSEFNITPYLQKENTLVVLVLKWCDGSYFEDQDKFRNSGIFRDVYLLHRSKTAIRDFRVTTPIVWNNNQASEALIRVQYDTYDSAEVVAQARLQDSSGAIVASAQATLDEENTGCIELSVSTPKLWNAEQPYCYTLTLHTPNEYITMPIGIREVEVDNGVIKLNKQAIKFKGANLHESDPVTGPVISEEQLLRDLHIMKAHNINAIRTSHYPQAPKHYDLFTQLGFYIIDEADNESHGTTNEYNSDVTIKAINERWNRLIANNPDYIESTLDRAQLCVIRDKNQSCVLIWSMGNECAYGITFEKALAWTKQYDSTRLTHYESSRYVDNDREYDFSNIDIHSRMYPPLEEVERYFSNEGPQGDGSNGDDGNNGEKPYIMCEYSHSMGNGAGDYADYQKLIYEHPRFAGGFVWEWCDHAVYRGTTATGVRKYAYGGDSGEYPHDSNFCVDGLVYPDRTPHTGLRELKNVFSPIKIVGYNNEKHSLTIHNYSDFLNTQDFAYCSFTISADNSIIDNAQWTLGDNAEASNALRIAPHASCEITIPQEVYELIPFGTSTIRLVMEVHALNNPEVFEKGIIGVQEILLGERTTALEKNSIRATQKALCDSHTEQKDTVDYSQTADCIIISNQHFTYRLSKLTGLFTSIVHNNQTFLTRAMECNIWRAPTDNDMYIKAEWKRAKYDHAYLHAYEVNVERIQNTVQIKVEAAVVAPSVQPIATVQICWLIDALGNIHADIQARRNTDMPFLPRFGVRIFTPNNLELCQYSGYGPFESYIDKHHASTHGEYCAKVQDFYEPYIKPQECGNHHDCNWAYLYEPSGIQSLRIDGISYDENAQPFVSTFDFQALPYSQEQLEHTAHNYELPQHTREHVVCIDFMQSGVGSNSCGPDLQKKYQLNHAKIHYGFTLSFNK
ncbi:MAG: glycoside hydrolase family 2 TIM barrel-domain containing protein [Bifidobacteriaceae bacterium]|nr:glycoside hydrolase family 2 TIM barrel-domain containing protein [Bifidobacteriaceae bacterium]